MVFKNGEMISVHSIATKKGESRDLSNYCIIDLICNA